jgi:hypothetical protein
MFPRDTVCLRNMSVDNLHKGDTEDNNNNNNKVYGHKTFERIYHSHSYWRIYPIFMELEGLLPWLQKSDSSISVQSTFRSVLFELHFNIINSLMYNLKESTLSVGLQIKSLYVFAAYPMRSGCFNRLMPIDLMMLMMFSVEYELRSSNVFPPPTPCVHTVPQHAVCKIRCSWLSRSCSHYFFVVMKYACIVSVVYHKRMFKVIVYYVTTVWLAYIRISVA